MLKQALKMGFHSTPDSGWLDGLLSPWRTEVGKLSLIRNASALNTNLTAEITHRLPNIAVPTLILWGEDDRFQVVKYAERLARDIPGAELQRIADARHFVMIDQPAQVHSHIRAFLERASDSAAPPSAPRRGIPDTATFPRSKRLGSMPERSKAKPGGLLRE
jgi:pimeloyl-ACP methyl ester carboxylesterase